jgi:hypothetical protein
LTQFIEIVISPSGDTKIETKGFAGPSCRAASQSLEAALGASQRERLTEEYFRATATTILRQENRP